MTTEIAKRQETRVGTEISRNQALYLLKTVWPDAPINKQIEAAIICHQYRLNPLMKQIFLVKYDHYEYDPKTKQREKTGEDWDVRIGIKANRNMARINHNYKIIDGPRMMTKEEQESILGEIDNTKFWAIIKIEEDGRVYPGYGNHPKDKMPIGTENGNSRQNQAFIRAERNAIDKMAPGELPDNDVEDEAYQPIINLDQALIEGSNEFKEQVKDDIDSLYPTQDKPLPAPVPPPTSVIPPPEQKEAVQNVPTGLSDKEKLIISVREKKPSLKTDKNVLDWIEARFKVTKEQIESDPSKVWVDIKDLI